MGCNFPGKKTWKLESATTRWNGRLEDPEGLQPAGMDDMAAKINDLSVKRGYS